MPTNRCQNTMAFSSQVLTILLLHIEKPRQTPSVDHVENTQKSHLAWAYPWAGNRSLCCVPSTCHRNLLCRSHLLPMGGLVRMIAQDGGFHSSHMTHWIPCVQCSMNLIASFSGTTFQSQWVLEKTWGWFFLTHSTQIWNSAVLPPAPLKQTWGLAF